MFGSLSNINTTLLISLILIRRKYYVSALKIFIVLYVIGQIIGYGLGVDILKTVIPSSTNPKSGVAYQVITSTIFPLLLAFVIRDIYNIKEGLTHKFLYE